MNTRERTVLGLIVASLAAAASYLWWRPAAQAPVPPAATAVPAAKQADSEPVVSPLPASGGGPAPAALDPVEVAHGLGLASLPEFVFTDDLLRRFVATIDEMPRAQVALKVRSIRPIPGLFQVEGGEEQPRVADANSARFTAFVAAVEQLSPEGVGSLYQRLYPRLQTAYESLGSAEHSFHVRLLYVIDQLLGAPDIPASAALVRPNVLYLYADPSLEHCTAGQKALMRTGPANEARLKAALRVLRAAIATHPPR